MKTGRCHHHGIVIWWVGEDDGNERGEREEVCMEDRVLNAPNKMLSKVTSTLDALPEDIHKKHALSELPIWPMSLQSRNL